MRATQSSIATSRSRSLPDAFAADADRLARFKREAQVLASLNHPHIAAIYGFEDSGSTHALVLELVEGPTLADRIAQGLVPLDEALADRRQIAEALEAAHEQGIIHRDLKPANIKVRDGRHGEGPRLRPREGVGTSICSECRCDCVADDHVARDDDRRWMILGTAAYMVAGAGEGPRRRQAERHLGVRLCALRDADGHGVPSRAKTPETLAAILRGEPEWNALSVIARPRSRACCAGVSNEIRDAACTTSRMLGSR